MAKRKIERVEEQDGTTEEQEPVVAVVPERVELPPQNTARPELPAEEVRTIEIKCPSAAGIRRVQNYVLVEAGRQWHKISVRSGDKVTCELKIIRAPVANKMIEKPDEAK
ncbi:MAG: hypothetical protein PHI12_12120 [Dehalococcoidales bacterium]|nr:hypothetical protein [Dehalococcoidales bacterium]